MVMEGDLTQGGEHTVQYADDVLQNCTTETCIILLINVTLINSMNNFNIKIASSEKPFIVSKVILDPPVIVPSVPHCSPTKLLRKMGNNCLICACSSHQTISSMRSGTAILFSITISLCSTQDLVCKAELKLNFTC